MPEYFEIFRTSIGDLNVFLEGLFSSFFKSWPAGYTILDSNGSRHLDMLESYEEFCMYIRFELGMNHTCIECDKQRLRSAAQIGKPCDYWCAWGLLDVITPIIAHGVTVGGILCGQKRLLDETMDKEGIEIMKATAKKEFIEERIPELLSKRVKCGAVSTRELLQMKKLLWRTSNFISHILENVIDEADRKPVE